MASYNLKFNSDDSVFRHIIIGLLADLNNKLVIYRQIDNNTRAQIDVPFYYSITGDDQFLRDQFLFTTASGPNCYPDAGFADGNYDVVPRGIVNLNSIAVDSAKLVNKRTVGNYTRMDENGAMQGYVAEFEMIPLNINMDVEILVSSTLDAFKITESIVKTLYKSNYFNVEVGHLDEGTYRLSSYYALPEDYDIQKPLEFTFEDKDKYKIVFPIEVNTFLPSFDNGLYGPGASSKNGSNSVRDKNNTEMHIGNRMFELTSAAIIEINPDTNQFDTRIVDESDKLK
jgi:hypothetical protein